MSARIRLLVLVALVAPRTAWGQAPVAAGERVRVRYDNGSLKGVLHEIAPTGLRLRTSEGDTTAVIDFNRVTGVERSVGRGRNFVKYFFLTVGASATVIGAISAMSWSPCTETGFLACLMHPNTRGDAFVMGFVGGGVVGVPLGLILGLAAREEKWERAVMPPQSGGRIALRPIVGRNVGLAASIPFGGR
jgi:hypothetical protein